VIAGNRNPDSYVGGATVLHTAADSPRASRDVDLFHDTTESLAASVEKDRASLCTAGFAVDLEQSQGTFQRAEVRRGNGRTKLEWVFDSAFRFFPVEADAAMGWRLNFWDAATNKILALFGRHEFRDYVDALYLHEKRLCLGALIWASAGKDPGLTPELILDWIRRNGFYTAAEIKTVDVLVDLDLVQMKRTWLQALAEAESLIAQLPLPDMGCLYLDQSGAPVCPQPKLASFVGLTRHFGSVKGAWPRVVGT